MALTLVTSDLIGGLDYSKLTGTVPTWNQNTSGTAAGLSATLVVGSGGTGVTSITALKNVLDDETWTFANNITATGTLTVNGTGNSAFNGDLYIVGKKLDISAPSGGNSYIRFSDTNSSAKIWRVGTSLSSRGVFNIYNQTDDSFPFNILANGNVGIGVTDPKNIFNIFSGTDTMMGFWGTSTYSAMQSVNLANTVLKDMRFDASKYYFIGGNVGIGTTSPLGKLHIVSSGGTDGLRVNAGTSSSNNAFVINNEADNATLFYIRGNGDSSFGGKVGILTTPSTVSNVGLSVAGTSAASGVAAIELKGSSNAAPWRMISSWDGANPFWGLFYPNDSSYKLSVKSDGNIAIPRAYNNTNNAVIYIDSTISSGASTYQGSLLLQAGGAGSASYGSGLRLYGHAHASSPGSVEIGLSAVSGAKFTVDSYGAGGGTDIFTVERNTYNVYVTNGNLIAGSTSDVTGTHYFNKGASVNGGILYAGSSTTGRFSLVVQASDSGYNNSPATCLKVGATSSSGRSISAAGTVITGGTDYAEYMTKAVTDVISKGDIVGVNSDGLLTNIFNDAISFVIKSTDPSFVGGDTWGIESEDKDEIEEARIKVDRIAFSGQVPCNVTGASVGDYIIPVASSDGKITGEAVSNPTFEQYKISVGKVWKIMNNGNSWVAVKIG